MSVGDSLAVILCDAVESKLSVRVAVVVFTAESVTVPFFESDSEFDRCGGEWLSDGVSDLVGDGIRVSEFVCDGESVLVPEDGASETVSLQLFVVLSIPVAVLVRDVTVELIVVDFRVFEMIILIVPMEMVFERSVRVTVPLSVGNDETEWEKVRVRVGLDTVTVPSTEKFELREGVPSDGVTERLIVELREASHDAVLDEVTDRVAVQDESVRTDEL